MWIQESFFKYTIGAILVLLIILLLYYTSPVFSPILWFVGAIALPVLFSTFLYYILRPVVNFFARWMPRYLAIGIAYLFVAIPAVLIGVFFVPEALDVINNVSPEKIESVQTTIKDFLGRFKGYFYNVPGVENLVVSYLPKIQPFIYKFTVSSISALTSIAISLALTPFVLYYFLRDDALFSRFILRFVPNKFQEETTKILDDVDSTLSAFILAQLTLAAVVGFFLFLGYLLIGLPHALALGLFGMIFYIIPFLGTFIAIIPALLLAASINFAMVIKVVLVMVVAHMLEADVLTPRLMSHHLKIHPLTIILLLLAAGSLYGILGLLLVTPTYAILKVITWNFYKIARLHYAQAKAAEEAEAQSSPEKG